MHEIDCVVDSHSILGEGTYWDHEAQVLWWIDIWGSTLHRYDPATGQDRTWTTPEYLGTLAVRKRGGLVVSMVSGFHFFDPTTGAFTPIVDPEADLEDTRFNDGKTDRQGRFWSGTMFEAAGKPPVRCASLWRLDADRTAHRVVTGVGCSNGLAWSPDSRTMYYTDSHTNVVWAFDFDPHSGAATNRRVFIDLSAERMAVDGATVDAEGTYWLTVPFHSLVLAYDPSGKRIRTITLPFDLPTCCEFGGPDLDVLYVTSATLRRDAAVLAGQTKPGGLFAIRGLGVRGLPLVPYAG
jgi:sugar lactone lactonase YvrE